MGRDKTDRNGLVVCTLFAVMLSETFLYIMADSCFDIDVPVDTSINHPTTIARTVDHMTFAERTGSSTSR